MKAKSTVLGLAAIVAALVSCQKENHESVVNDVAKESIASLTVNSNEWLPDETRSQYTPGTGIALSGSENIALYYKAGGSFNSTKVLAKGSNGQYTFTVPASVSDATWFSVIPYTTTFYGQTSGGVDRVFARLGPVQFPGANTFDPASDFLVGEPFTVSEGSATINKVKRMTAPLRLLISGLEDGEKIYTCTMSLSTQAVGLSTALQGQLFIQLSDDYDAAKFYASSGQSIGNAITAEYADGLSAIDGSWPVWLSVNPITMKSGADLTVTVTTGTRTITRTVTLLADGELMTTMINKITFNIAGKGASSKESICQDFTAAQTISGSSLSLKASNGETYAWPVSGATQYTTSTDALAKALQYKASGSFTFPTIYGKKITSARVYAHPASSASTSVATTLTVGSDVYNFSLNATDKTASPTYKGGYVDIALPEGVEDLSGQTVTVTASTSGIAVISAITLFTADSGSVEPDANDYYAQFNAGRDITIGDKTFNKSTTTARLIKLYEGEPGTELLKDYTESGIIFLDYDEADGKDDAISFPMISPKNCVYIGRYKNHQPTINFTNYLAQTANLYLKNVKIASSGAAINSWKLTQNAEMMIEDCTIVAGDAAIKEQHATYYFTKVILSNCVISVGPGKSVYTINYRSSVMSQPDFSKLSIENCVMYATGGANSSAPVIKLHNKDDQYVETPNLALEFNNNSIYNISYGYSGLVKVYNLKTVNFLKNAGVASMAAGTNATLLSYLGAVANVEGTALNGNYFAESSASGGKWTYWNTAISAITRKWDDKLDVTVSPFSSADAANGYFPVNAEVTSAGASYSTKLWRNW